MTTATLFQDAVTAMSSFGDIAWGGEACRINVTPQVVMIELEDDAHPAQALLSWLGSLSGTDIIGRRLYHHHGNGRLFACVGGNRAGLAWDVYATFTGDDAAMLCEYDDDRGPLHVHRLRAVQMRQLAASVGGAA